MWFTKMPYWIRCIIVGLCVSILLIITITANPQNNSQSKQQYVTVFFDDFEELNRDVWTFHSQERPAYGGRYNSRFRTNDQNAYISQGCLVLDCSKTATDKDGSFRNSNGEEVPVEYIAPYISTCDKLAMTEGRISARIRVSKGIEDGVFPFCFWTFGQNSTWPYAHEMDIMEASAGVSKENKMAENGTLIPVGSHVSTFGTHLHVRTQNVSDLRKDKHLKLNWALKNKNRVNRSLDFISLIDPTDWHVYGVEWDTNTIKYFVDGVTTVTYSAKALGAVNANGEVGFFYPQDIRFNIKAGEKTTDQHGYMYIDWVKTESKRNIACTSIDHEDVKLSVGGSIYINPSFNTGCSNKAFSVSIANDGVLTYKKYLNDSSQMVVHKIIGRKSGETIVTLHTANDSIVNSFKVTVFE